MTTLAALALEDFDISRAANRWMRYPNPGFNIPQHAFHAGRNEGAFFLYGSMNESLALSALRGMVEDTAHPQRELALFCRISLPRKLMLPSGHRSEDAAGKGSG